MNNSLKAILLSLVSMAVFTVVDTSAKLVTQSLPIPVAVFARFFIAFVLTALFIWQRGEFSLMRTSHPLLQVARGGLLIASSFCNVFAMGYLQLSQTSAIFFTVPLIICALSMPVLGEPVGIRRWIAVLVGFAGVLVIMQPWSSGFHPAMLMALASAILGAFYNIITRKVGMKDRAEISLLFIGAAGSVFAALPLYTHWQMPVGWQWWPLLAMGLAGATGHFMLIQAHRLAPASTLAPFIYTQIIWMTLAGYVVFRNVPDMSTIVGAAIVIASGAYIFNRERKKGVETIVAAPAD